ncbi:MULTISPECIES: hypothetical protein [Streptomyces]|nr:MULTISPECIES: hypothetical protein [Streptomyces]
MPVEIHDELSIGEAPRENVAGVHGEGGLPDTGHAVDHVNGQPLATLL